MNALKSCELTVFDFYELVFIRVKILDSIDDAMVAVCDDLFSRLNLKMLENSVGRNCPRNALSASIRFC